MAEDYFTVIEEDNHYKLNINSYIDKKEIDKIYEGNECDIKVVSKNIYMDYEEYIIEIKNKTNKSIALDGLRKNDNIHLLDSNNKKRKSYINEITPISLITKPGTSSVVKIKFYKPYSITLYAETVVFSDVILDYDIYNKTKDKKKYDSNIEITIDL